MNEEKGNVFKFGLYQENDVVSETMFSADVFNPVIRYSVDIRSDVSSIISRLQRVLSTRNSQLNFKFDFNDISYDNLKTYKDSIHGVDINNYLTKLSKPKTKKKTIKGNVISGVEYKFGLYINNNPIVERIFYVNNYNPNSRFSNELASVTNEIVSSIIEQLKKSDVKHMWDDYDLINHYGLYINQIRDLSKNKREKMLTDIKSNV